MELREREREIQHNWSIFLRKYLVGEIKSDLVQNLRIEFHSDNYNLDPMYKIARYCPLLAWKMEIDSSVEDGN